MAMTTSSASHHSRLRLLFGAALHLSLEIQELLFAQSQQLSEIAIRRQHQRNV
jgi:hypothetical protein